MKATGRDRKPAKHNRLASITTSPGTFATGAFAYDPSGNIKSIGSDSFFRYDLQDQLRDATVNATGFSYQYDGFGNLTSSTGPEPISAPVNSATNRLLGPSFTYLPTGSLSAAPGATYGYDGFERMVSATTAAGTVDYLYDADGSRVAASDGGSCQPGSRQFVRGDGGSLLTEFRRCGSDLVRLRNYLYAGPELIGTVQESALSRPFLWGFDDPCGGPEELRVFHLEVADYNDTCAGAGIQLFWRSDNGCYDFRQPVASVAASGSCPAHQHILTSHYDTSDPVPDTGCYVARAVHANGELGPPSDEVCPAVDPLPGVDCLVGYLPGTGCPDPPDLVATRSIRYFLTDHLGTPRTIARADGGPVADTMQLGPFGEAMDAPSCAQRRQFTGHERDDETGLDYMMARYYGRGMGRFLAVDPVRGKPGDPQSWNMYTLASNNPVLYVDLDGRSPLKAVGVIIELTKKGYKAISKPQTRKQLERAVKKGKNVKATSGKEAKALARQASGGRKPVRDAPHPAPDGGLEGRMPHYHLHGRPKGAGHIFYSVVAGVTAAHYAEGRGPMAEGGAFVLDFFNPLSVLQDAVDIGRTIGDVGTRAIVGSEDDVEFTESDESNESN